jgi:hypothetical protein
MLVQNPSGVACYRPHRLPTPFLLFFCGARSTASDFHAASDCAPQKNKNYLWGPLFYKQGTPLGFILN